MRVRAMGIVVAAVAPWTLVACGDEDDGYLFDECPTVSAEDRAEMEKMIGAADDQPGAVDRSTTYVTVICR